MNSNIGIASEVVVSEGTVLQVAGMDGISWRVVFCVPPAKVVMSSIPNGTQHEVEWDQLATWLTVGSVKLSEPAQFTPAPRVPKKAWRRRVQ